MDKENNAHGQKRTTPLFVNVGVLHNLDYNYFACLIKESVPHVSKLSKLGVTYKDDDREIMRYTGGHRTSPL